MKRVLALLLALVALVALFVGAIFLASELGGEVVVVSTQGDAGPTETRLWVVDHEGAWWLRAGVPTSGWLQRMQADPSTRVVRGEVTRSVRAVPIAEPAVRDRIHALMREKYGLADSFISIIRDGDQSVAVRLDPAPAN